MVVEIRSGVQFSVDARQEGEKAGHPLRKRRGFFHLPEKIGSVKGVLDFGEGFTAWSFQQLTRPHQVREMALEVAVGQFGRPFRVQHGREVRMSEEVGKCPEAPSSEMIRDGLEELYR